MDAQELAKQIEESNITEEELKQEGWSCICCNLPKELADSLKNNNPGSVIINDSLNPGQFTVMKFGSIPEKDLEENKKQDDLWFDN